MAMAIQMATFLHQYLYSSAHAIKQKDDDAIKFGILSTAMINAAAFIRPAETHGGVIVHGIASRHFDTAKSEASKYGIPKAYGSYDELLNDSEIEAVYISLPNGLHAEWARKSLEAGKHVLLEKPFTSNAKQARELTEIAVQKNLILTEAFHWRHHPAAHKVLQLVESGKYGDILRTHARMTTPAGSIPSSDIRWDYELAGGSLQDMTYVISSTRFFVGTDAITDIVSAKARPYKNDKRVDESITAELRPVVKSTGRTVKSTIYTDMNRANFGYLIPRLHELPSIEIEMERATIYFYNFMMPHLYHYITITPKNGGRPTTFKMYQGGPRWGSRGEAWWSTYRYQLESFVDKLKGREPVEWVTLADSIAQMETIDAIYEKTGLGVRP